MILASCLVSFTLSIFYISRAPQRRRGETNVNHNAVDSIRCTHTAKPTTRKETVNDKAFANRRGFSNASGRMDRIA